MIQRPKVFVSFVMNPLINIKASSMKCDLLSVDRPSPLMRIVPQSKKFTSPRLEKAIHNRDLNVLEKTPADWSSVLDMVGRSEDRSAFSELFDHFGPRVKSLMLKYGASNDLAEEIVQETFVLVWRKASQFDSDKAAASTWIFTIARNKRIDILRRQTRPEPDMNDPAMLPEPTLNSEELISGKERALAVRRALEKLPKNQRDVLQRSYFSDETHSEIASSLKTPLGTVKSRLRLALSKLRTIIDEDIGEGSI